MDIKSVEEYASTLELEGRVNIGTSAVYFEDKYYIVEESDGECFSFDLAETAIEHAIEITK